MVKAEMQIAGSVRARSSSLSVVRKTSRFLSLVSLGLLLCAAAPHATAEEACAFTAPAGWKQAGTTWEGACRDGRADGLGVLREVDDKKAVQRLFFGRLKQGEPELGVIEQSGGYVAGTFKGGKPVPSDEQQTTIDAFRAAEKAAKQISDKFRKSGDKASARLYKVKAKQLGEQIE